LRQNILIKTAVNSQTKLSEETVSTAAETGMEITASQTLYHKKLSLPLITFWHFMIIEHAISLSYHIHTRILKINIYL